MATATLLWVVAWTLTARAPCIGHQLSSSSVSSLLELAGFAPSCVSRALAQCHEVSDPLPAQQVPSSDISNLTQTIQQFVNTLQSLQGASQPTTRPQRLPRPQHCQHLKESGDSGRGVRRVFPFPCCPDRGVNVFCDQLTDGGGWTVFQRREDFPPHLDFFRTWVEYQMGFGDPEKEFWLGLDNLHQLTSQSLQELRIDLADFDNVTRWAKYGFFHVGDALSMYTLRCGSYTGDVGDSLSGHSGMKFTSKDVENDQSPANCATASLGAWWYKYCHTSNLNGKYLRGKNDLHGDGVVWESWRGYYYSLRSAEMKIRPAFPRLAL